MALAGSVPDRDWAYLPVPVLCTILDMLPPEHIDHLRFGAVCKQWKSVSEDHNQAKQQRCGKQLPPMLLIPTENHTPSERRLYSVVQGKIIYNVELRVPRLRKI